MMLRKATRQVCVGLAFVIVSVTVAYGSTRDFQATWARAAGGTQTADYRIYVSSAIDVPRVRGVIFLYPGSGGDWRFRADDTVWQEAARSLGFALVGAGSNAGYMSISEADARSSFTAILAAAAAVTGRAELINAPTVFTGFSLGGYVSTEMANHVRDRVIAAVAQRGSSVLNSSQPAETRKVPVLFMPGSEDSNGLTDPNVTSANFSNWRSNDGHSGYAIDWRTPHDTFVNQGWSMAWSWIAETIALRYPEGVLPGLDVGGTVTLKALPLESGWLGQRPYVASTSGADRSAYVTIAPYASYSGTVGTASWLPNETVARAYQAQTSYDGLSSRTEIPLQGPLAIVGVAKPDTAVQPGQVNPPQMAILPVGSTFDIIVDPRGFGASGPSAPIQSMAYYDGSQLLAVQAVPGTNGWRYAHTLSSRGLHTLTAVATDALGNKTAALRTVVAASARAQGTSLYRFERSPGLQTDHYDLLNLTTNATTGTGPQQVALDASGAGAAFPRQFNFEFGQNAHAARFSAANGTVFTCPDSPLLPSGTTPFTVEAYVNLTSGGAGGTFRTIAAHGTGSTGSTLSWQLVVTGEGSGQGARRLVLQFCGSAAGALDTINSGFELQTNVDYYVAAAFTPTNTSATGITFYFKDLSAGSALQASSRTHTQTSITNASTAFAVGNRYDRGTGWDGLLDEVRLTTRALSADELLVNQVPLPTTPGRVTPEDSRIAYSDYVRRSFVAAPFDAAVTLARFDRLLPIAGKGYEWDNPGTRIRFRTDATNAQVTLYYSTNHCSTSARNSKGFYRVDGVTNAAWTYQTVQVATVRTQEQMVVTLAVPPGGGFHDYELVLPYGDSVDFQGLQVNTNALFQTPAERPATRYLAYGDSITQGFTASEVGRSYAYLVAQKRGWQLVNLGLAGRATTASDGTTVGSLGADVISVLIGVNDWQGGVPLATYSNRLDAFLTNLRTLQPAVPVYLLTPLWVDASWDPPSDIASLESYRQVVRAVAAARNDSKLSVIEGPDLIDPSTAYFDPVLVHPNDSGFAMMSDRLVARMETAATNATSTTGKMWLGGVSANWDAASTWTPTGMPLSAEAVSISNAAAAILTVQSGTAAAAASLAFDNASGKNATLLIANGASLAVGGAITDAGAGSATLSIGNTNPVSAASVLTATSAALATLGLNASACLTTGFDISLSSQLQLGVGIVNADITYRQTNGTMNIAGQGYGLCLLEAYARPTAGTQTYILDGGTLKAERIGVANGNGSNISPYFRYAGTGVLEFNQGTIANRSDTLSVWFENGSAMESYNGTSFLVPDTQRSTSKPVTVRLSQSGTHTFNATHVNNQIVFSPSARLTDKAGESGTLTKTGPGTLLFAGNGLYATNDWTGDTTVSQGTVKVDYSVIAGAQGGRALSDAYSPRSRLLLSGGGFELAGRSNATNSTFSGVAVSVGTATPWSGNYTLTLPSTAGLVVGQAVSNAFLPTGAYIRTVNSATQIGLSHMPTGTVDQTGQTVAFGAATFTSAQTVSNVVLTGAASTVTVTPRGIDTQLTFGNVGGAGGLVKAGTGTLRLTGEVTLAGAVAVTAGMLDFVGSGITLLTNAITGSGTFRQSGSGVTAVDAASGVTNTFSGAVVVDGGTLQQGSANGNQRRGLSAAASYTVNRGGMIITTRDSMNDYASYSLNGGTLKMAKGFQQIGGALTLNNGSLVAGPGQGPLYQAFAFSGNVVVTGTAPSVIRAEAGTYNGVHLAFNSTTGVRRTFRVEDVTGTAAADLTVSANLLDSSHTGSSAGLTKTGAGTLVLSGGTNLYSGATAVSNGTLLVSGGGFSNSAVTVSAGATFGTADATFSRVVSLTLAERATLVWTYDGNAATAGRIAVTGTLTLPSSLTLDVSGSGFLYSGQVLFSAGALAGATDLSGWTTTGVPYSSQVVRVGNELQLQVNRGTLMELR